MTSPEKKSTETKGKRGGYRPGSGRPKGRKDAKTLEIEAAAKKHAGDALKALVEVAKRGASEGARVSAATALLDRGYGRPKQAIEHSGGIETYGVLRVPTPVTDDEWVKAAKPQQAALGRGGR